MGHWHDKYLNEQFIDKPSNIVWEQRNEGVNGRRNEGVREQREKEEWGNYEVIVVVAGVVVIAGVVVVAGVVA